MKAALLTNDLPHPRVANHCIGHDEAFATLCNRFHSDRMAHSFIISGPQGIGKATLAYQFARYILTDGKPSDNHPICRRIATGSHGDLLTIEPAEDSRDIKVDEVRKLTDFLHKTPSESRYQVVVIDTADQLNHNAANAILKSLEEPADHTILLLISHVIGSLLPTIKSRCQIIQTSPPSLKESQRIVAQLYPEISSDELTIYSQLASGAPGTASMLYSQHAYDTYQQLLSLLQTLPRLDMVAIHTFGETFTNKKNLAQWDIFTLLLQRFITQISYYLATSQHHPSTLALEEQTIANLPNHSIAQWLDIAQHITPLLRDEKIANIDRKQITLLIFETIRKYSL